MLSKRDGAKLLAGGQSLVTLMKLRLAAPQALIDLNGVSELDYIREDNGTIAVGALTRHDKLATSSIIRDKCPVLSEAAGLIADQQVRNRGTIGGSLAHADPTADLPTACVDLGTTIIIASPKGPRARSVRSEEFFRDYFTTSLGEDEIIHEVEVPIPPPGSGGAYLKLTKGHNDFALVSVAAQLTLDNGICKGAQIVLGAVAPTPVHAKNAETRLMGSKLDRKSIEEAAQKASEQLSPQSDFRASAGYRLEMVRDLTRRALQKAVSRVDVGA